MNYWEHRYSSGGSSGAGSRGRLAKYKARFINRYAIGSVFDLGCGDGFVASLLNADYIGTDPSSAAVEMARKAGLNVVDFSADVEADTVLSIDVLQHLVDEDEYRSYMARLFASARKKVIIYAPCSEQQPPRCAPHVRFRDFRAEVPWPLAYHEANPYAFKGDPQHETYSEFFVYG